MVEVHFIIIIIIIIIIPSNCTLMFLHQNSIRNSFLLDTCYMPCAPYTSWLDNSNNSSSAVHILELLIMQSSPFPAAPSHHRTTQQSTARHIDPCCTQHPTTYKCRASVTRPILVLLKQLLLANTESIEVSCCALCIVMALSGLYSVNCSVVKFCIDIGENLTENSNCFPKIHTLEFWNTCRVCTSCTVYWNM